MCAWSGGNLFLIFVVENQILNYSETLRRKTLFVSSLAGVKLPHGHGMAADENKKVFYGVPRCCGS